MLFRSHFGDKQLDPMEGAEFKHDMPFSVGALIDFEIYNNFFIESGLTFSILKSTFSNSMHNLTEGKQKANFIGIPLAVNYNFFNYKSLSIYAGLGAKIDINLKLSQKYYLNSQLAEFDKRYKKPIYSGRVKVGITYKIIDTLYLFAEPSIAKYNKSSNINTAWTAKKFNPELQFGLKTAF